MSASWKDDVRRHALLVAALAVLLLLGAVDVVWFRPTAQRLQNAVKQASKMGLALDPDHATPMIPPRLFALITENAMPAAIADEQGNSGTLTAELLRDLTTLTSKHGIMVLITEPDPVTQLPQSLQVRAHLRAHCRYGEFVALLDDMARSRTLFAVDRFSFTAQPGSQAMLEMWVSRFVLKQTKGRG